ncbi:MAG TPA: nuclear transport factor 2 family protein [Caulobacterales bacterium]|nr:nuclear transport factor 2 family protein [Caulobacterales bacterium]
MLTPSVEVERQLMNVDRAFSDMSAQKGMAAAFNAYMDPREGMMIRPGGMSEGAAQIAQVMADTPADVKLSWTPDRVYVSNSGDFGMTSGRFTRSAGSGAPTEGRYVTVWRKNNSGEWKALADIGNADPAPRP